LADVRRSEQPLDLGCGLARHKVADLVIGAMRAGGRPAAREQHEQNEDEVNGTYVHDSDPSLLLRLGAPPSWWLEGRLEARRPSQGSTHGANLRIFARAANLAAVGGRRIDHGDASHFVVPVPVRSRARLLF